jgi:NhaP-type Na+/H+ or K+/H+ antiporter
VLNEGVAGGGTLAATAVWTILLSIVAHGLTARPLAATLANHDRSPSTG